LHIVSSLASWLISKSKHSNFIFDIKSCKVSLLVDSLKSKKEKNLDKQLWQKAPKHDDI